MSDPRIIKVELDEATILRRNADIEQERRVAIFDLIDPLAVPSPLIPLSEIQPLLPWVQHESTYRHHQICRIHHHETIAGKVRSFHPSVNLPRFDHLRLHLILLLSMTIHPQMRLWVILQQS